MMSGQQLPSTWRGTWQHGEWIAPQAGRQAAGALAHRGPYPVQLGDAAAALREVLHVRNELLIGHVLAQGLVRRGCSGGTRQLVAARCTKQHAGQRLHDTTAGPPPATRAPLTSWRCPMCCAARVPRRRCRTAAAAATGRGGKERREEGRQHHHAVAAARRRRAWAATACSGNFWASARLKRLRASAAVGEQAVERLGTAGGRQGTARARRGKAGS